MTGEIIHFQRHRDLKRAQPYRKQTVRGADLADDGEGDPQPDIDCETLDRLYRELNSGA